MRQLDLEINRPPYGASAEHRRTGIRLHLKTKGNGELMYADLSPAAAASLRDELTAALASQAPEVGALGD